MNAADPRPPKPPPARSRIPADSVFYSKVIPAILLALALATVVFILIAAGVLLGWVPFR